MSLFWFFFRYKGKLLKRIKHCSGHPGFVYPFQYDQVECYEKYLKFKKDFPFKLVGDLEMTIGYISEIEGGIDFLLFNI